MSIGLYFHPQTYLTAKPKNEIELLGAMPDYEYVRETIYNKYGSDLTLNKVDFGEYTSVHTDEYVDSILNASRDQLYYFIPGYEYALGVTATVWSTRSRQLFDTRSRSDSARFCRASGTPVLDERELLRRGEVRRY